jgi:hypothetical protein
MPQDNDTYFAACTSEGIWHSSPLTAGNAEFSTSFTSNENGAVDCSRKHSHLMPPPEPDILAQGSTLSAALIVVGDVTQGYATEQRSADDTYLSMRYPGWGNGKDIF